MTWQSLVAFELRCDSKACEAKARVEKPGDVRFTSLYMKDIPEGWTEARLRGKYFFQDGHTITRHFCPKCSEDRVPWEDEIQS